MTLYATEDTEILKTKQLWREDSKNHAWTQILFQKPDTQVEEKPVLLKNDEIQPKWTLNLPACSAERWKSFQSTSADSQSTVKIRLHDLLLDILM